jgi:hypothetical protein
MRTPKRAKLPASYWGITQQLNPGPLTHVTIPIPSPGPSKQFPHARAQFLIAPAEVTSQAIRGTDSESWGISGSCEAFYKGLVGLLCCFGEI